MYPARVTHFRSPIRCIAELSKPNTDLPKSMIKHSKKFGASGKDGILLEPLKVSHEVIASRFHRVLRNVCVSGTGQGNG